MAHHLPIGISLRRPKIRTVSTQGEVHWTLPAAGYKDSELDPRTFVIRAQKYDKPSQSFLNMDPKEHVISATAESGDVQSRFAVPGLEVKQKYRFKVAGKNRNFRSTFSDWFEVTVTSTMIPKAVEEDEDSDAEEPVVTRPPRASVTAAVEYPDPDAEGKARNKTEFNVRVSWAANEFDYPEPDEYKIVGRKINSQEEVLSKTVSGADRSAVFEDAVSENILEGPEAEPLEFDVIAVYNNGETLPWELPSKPIFVPELPAPIDMAPTVVAKEGVAEVSWTDGKAKPKEVPQMGRYRIHVQRDTIDTLAEGVDLASAAPVWIEATSVVVPYENCTTERTKHFKVEILGLRNGVRYRFGITRMHRDERPSAPLFSVPVLPTGDLLEACKHSDELAAVGAIACGSDVTISDELGNTCLHYAVRNGLLRAVSHMNWKAGWRTKNHIGRTPIDELDALEQALGKSRKALEVAKEAANAKFQRDRVRVEIETKKRRKSWLNGLDVVKEILRETRTDTLTTIKAKEAEIDAMGKVLREFRNIVPELSGGSTPFMLGGRTVVPANS